MATTPTDEPLDRTVGVHAYMDQNSLETLKREALLFDQIAISSKRFWQVRRARGDLRGGRSNRNQPRLQVRVARKRTEVTASDNWEPEDDGAKEILGVARVLVATLMHFSRYRSSLFHSS